MADMENFTTCGSMAPSLRFAQGRLCLRLNEELNGEMRPGLARLCFRILFRTCSIVTSRTVPQRHSIAIGRPYKDREPKTAARNTHRIVISYSFSDAPDP
jgi:hypothetical protein